MDTSKFLSDYNNELWKKFYTPDDDLTKRYIQAIEKLEDLPATFYILKNTPESYGLGNLEIKPKYEKKIKTKPLLSLLENGDYETEKSKSDERITKGIKWIVKTLPSFKKYKDTDDLTFIINNHRLLMIEILEYYAYNNPKASLRTIEGRVYEFMRIIYIAYGVKTVDLYQKYSVILFELNNQFKLEKNKQQFSEREENANVDFEIIMAKQKELNYNYLMLDKKQEQSEEGYKLNQDLLIVSLYSLIPPNRDEIKELLFTTVDKTKDEDNDYVYISKDAVYLLLNKQKKKHDAIKFNLSKESPELASILKESYNNYKRLPVLTQLKDKHKQITISGINKRLQKIFEFTGKNIGTNSIRKSYITYLNSKKQLTVAEKDKIAEKMRTSRRHLDENYIKLPDKKEDTKEKEIIIINESKPPETKNTYKKHLEYNKEYYKDNKEEIRKKQKMNYDSKTPAEHTRRKILYLLNNDATYKDRVKETTITKYNITLKNGVYI